VNALLDPKFAVIPILVGPLQVLMAMLPAILLGIGSALLALFKPATFKLAIKLLWRVKVSLLIGIVIISGSVFGARAVWRKATNAISTAEAAAHDWPTFRGNAQRTGALPSGASPLAGGIQWAFAGEAKIFHSSPTIIGNRIYATSAEVGVFSSRGAIYCLDADTGGVVWKSVPDGYRATFSSPSISGKYLVTGEGLHQTRDGRIICLDVTRRGAVLWSFATRSHVESSAAIANGRAYIGAGDDGYYCFQLEPDAQGKPVMVWHLAGEKYPDAETSPVVQDGRVYFGLGVDGQAVVCVDADTGKELWRVATPSPVFTPPTIAHGKLFIGMGHGNFVESEEEVIAATPDRLRKAGKTAEQIAAASSAMQVGGEVWCIELATQKVDWRFKTDRTVFSAVVAGEGRVFFSSRRARWQTARDVERPHPHPRVARAHRVARLRRHGEWAALRTGAVGLATGLGNEPRIRWKFSEFSERCARSCVCRLARGWAALRRSSRRSDGRADLGRASRRSGCRWQPRWVETPRPRRCDLAANRSRHRSGGGVQQSALHPGCWNHAKRIALPANQRAGSQITCQRLVLQNREWSDFLACGVGQGCCILRWFKGRDGPEAAFRERIVRRDVVVIRSDAGFVGPRVSHARRSNRRRSARPAHGV
jgi:outer membrane protein assembly factor BamB